MSILAFLSTQVIDTTTVGRAVMTAADAAAARTAIGAGTSSFSGAYSALSGIPSTFAPSAHTHAASDIVSGIIGTARLATGTADSTTYLRGDQTWQAIAAGGISSLNALTDATQTFATGTTGTNFAIVSAAGVHTLNLPDASATARGVVTTGAQTFAGAKTFNSTINIGGSSAWYTIEGNGGYRLLLGNQGAAIGAGEGVSVRANDSFAWSSSAGNPGQNGRDLFLARDAANVLAVRNLSAGTSSQVVRIYNTYTSATSFERLNIGWATNVCTIGTEAGSGGGTLRGLQIGSAITSLLGFYGVTPVDQPATVADPTGGGTIDTEARTAIGLIIDRLQELGLIA